MSNPDLPTINADRLWRRHRELAAIGATEAGGLNRLALSDEDIAGHALVAGWAIERGFAVEIDAIGNLFIRRPGTDATLAAVGSGSHTDSQPMGGAFDGSFGVLSAFETLEALQDAGTETRHGIEAVIWNNEEGARFTPGLTGSGTHAGAYALDAMLALRDDAGTTMGECVARLKDAIPAASVRELGLPFAAFVEAHIEQATVLEDSGDTIGVVTGMQGNRRFEVTVTGENAHSGTTPRARRKDAFVAATDMTTALRDVFWDEDDVARFTIGKFEVAPGAKSVVPGHASFFIDFRHPSAESLKSMGDQVATVCECLKGPCEVRVEEVSSAWPVVFPDEIQNRIRASAEARGYRNRPVLSGAGHDARFMVDDCPTGMVFIPCLNGISHNEAEHAELEDMAAGAQVVSDVVTGLART